LTISFGRKIFIIVGFFIYGLSMILLSLANNYLVVIISRILQGIGSSSLFIVIDASVADVSQDGTRVKNFSTINSFSSAGQFVGVTLGFIIFYTYLSFSKNGTPLIGTKLAFSFFALVIFIAAITISLVLPETLQFKYEPINNRDSQFRLTNKWKIIMIANFISSAANTMLTPLVILMLQDKFKAPLYIISFFYIPMGLVCIFTPKYVGRLINHVDKLKIIAGSLVSSAVFHIFIPFVPTLAIFAAVFALSSLFNVAGDIAEQSLIADMSQEQYRGKGYGLYVFVSDLGAAFGPLLGTTLYMKSTVAPFIFSTLLLLSTSIIVIVWNSKQKDAVIG